MATQSSMERELQLVDRAIDKILKVSGDESELQKVLHVYLAPFLAKAGSPHHQVRDKVIKFSRTIETFIIPTDFPLPAQALIQQYKKTESPIIQLVSSKFITYAIDRADDYDRRHLAPIILNGISSVKTGVPSTTIFKALMRVVNSIIIPPRGSVEEAGFRDSLGLSDSKDASWVAERLGKLLLLKLPVLRRGNPLRAADAVAEIGPMNTSLDPGDIGFFAPEWDGQTWSAPYDDLTTLRRKVAQLLTSAAFQDREKIIPAVLAAGNSDSRISELGGDMLRRTTISFEDADLAKDLFKAHSTLSASYRIKILELLSKSAISTTLETEIADAVKLDLMDESGPLLPRSDLERVKLHRALFAYLNFVSRLARSQGRLSVGSSLGFAIQAYIEKQGWPRPNEPEQKNNNNGANTRAISSSIASSDQELRGMAYELVGSLAAADKITVEDAFLLSEWLLRSLAEDPTPDVGMRIESAIGELVRFFEPKHFDLDPKLAPLPNILYRYFILPSPPAIRSLKLVTVKWANRSMPFSHWKARFLDILAVAGTPGERNDVVEEGKRGLDPWTYRDSVLPEIPDWAELIYPFFYEDAQQHFNTSPTSNSSRRSSVVAEDVTLQNFSGERTNALPVALRFVRDMMFVDALPDFKKNPHWASQMEVAINHNITVRRKLQTNLRINREKPIHLVLQACLLGAVSPDTRHLDSVVEECLRYLVDIASVSPSEAIGHIATQGVLLFDLCASNSKVVRVLAAKAFGIVAAHPSIGWDAVMSPENPADAAHVKHLRAILQTMRTRISQWETAVGAEANAVEGAILAYAHLFSRIQYYGRGFQLSAIPFTLPAGLLLGQAKSLSMRDVALEAFAELWCARVHDSIPRESTEFSPREVINSLKELAERSNEKAIFALGRLAMALDDQSDGPNENSGDGLVNPKDQDGDHIDSILRILFSLEKKRETEIQFTVGEAITAAIAGFGSEEILLHLNVDEDKDLWAGGARDHRIKLVLDKLFLDCKDTAPFRIKAAGIWLFCIVQYAGRHSSVQSRLREAQVAFMRLLYARDELVQETASRGLSLVHERGDQQLREDLARDLVSSFTGSKVQLKVGDDTELFDPGALPTGEGKSVTSYKDIVALANEVGDQSLVYKFMSLATNAATWSARSAFGRFGLSNILSDSPKDPRIYPKLFRYRFDPNPNVRRSMDDIWKALVKDPNRVVEEHFHAIMTELLRSIVGKEWRSREASCGAIAELIAGQAFEKYDTYYGQIWSSALKVLDDVKESVRAAALRLCMNLVNNIIRLLEGGGSATFIYPMLRGALEFLMSPNGVESSVTEVKAFSLGALLDIAKKGGKTLKPVMAEMIVCLLGLHSTVEPEQINFAYQRLQEDKRGELDKMRASFVNQSPISEAVDNLLRQLDGETMAELAPRIEETIKSAVGMQTKIACARLLVDLVLRHREVMEPYSASFLRLMEKHALERNDEVSKAYAKATAYIMRVAPDAAKDRFFSKFIDLYLKDEDDGRRRKVADSILAFSGASPDAFNKYEARLLPLAYFGSHDTDAWVKKAFETVWESHAGNSRTVARYAREIATFVGLGLWARRWVLQHTAAFTIASMVPALASSSDATDGQISKESLTLVWPLFDKALALKTFSGKEKVLAVLPDFVAKGRILWMEDGEVAKQMHKAALREAKRNNEAYRPHAFEALWRFAAAREDLDMLDDIFEIVQPHLDELLEHDRMDTDHEGAATKGLEAVARGYSRPVLKEDAPAVLKRILDLLKPYLSHARFAVIKREVWYACVRDLMREAVKVPVAGREVPSAQRAAAALYLLSLDPDLVDVGTETQRKTRAEAMGALLAAKSRGVFGPPPEGPEKEQLGAMVRNAIDQERSVEVQAQLRLILEEMQ
ncbi:hypothetical protein ACRALDRAFT_1039618 [Sodiomyces alcalophilus JCM 7366]|uniref:uncharacterized protein n=1 Tax=Sodiomyces alcalophilus JCM 7366 TaxID=591952 RepID=UPI0039B680DE